MLSVRLEVHIASRGVFFLPLFFVFVLCLKKAIEGHFVGDVYTWQLSRPILLMLLVGFAALSEARSSEQRKVFFSSNDLAIWALEVSLVLLGA